MNTTHYCTAHESPLGTMLLVAHDSAITGIYFDAQKHYPTTMAARCTPTETPLLLQARRELDEYFAGRRRVFALPCAPYGSRFQQAVWRAIAEVPFGATISYAELARRAGHEGSPRAAGTATGRNPVGIVIPCHRIVGSNGSLTGYAGGLDKKHALLELEGALPAAAVRARARVQAPETMALF